MFTKFTIDTETNLFEELSKSITFEDITNGRQGATLVDYKDDLIPLVRTTTNYNNPAQKFLPIHYDIIEFSIKYDTYNTENAPPKNNTAYIPSIAKPNNTTPMPTPIINDEIKLFVFRISLINSSLLLLLALIGMAENKNVVINFREFDLLFDNKFIGAEFEFNLIFGNKFIDLLAINKFGLIVCNRCGICLKICWFSLGNMLWLFVCIR